MLLLKKSTIFTQSLRKLLKMWYSWLPHIHQFSQWLRKSCGFVNKSMFLGYSQIRCHILYDFLKCYKIWLKENSRTHLGGAKVRNFESSQTIRHSTELFHLLRNFLLAKSLQKNFWICRTKGRTIPFLIFLLSYSILNPQAQRTLRHFYCRYEIEKLPFQKKFFCFYVLLLWPFPAISYVVNFTVLC